MADNNSHVEESASNIANILQRKINEGAGLASIDRELNRVMEEEIVPYWKSVSPEDSGDYKDSVQVTKRAKRGSGAVGATDWKANFIEYGTGPDSKRPDESPFGPDTPTPEFAPAAKTAHRFGGSVRKK